MNLLENKTMSGTIVVAKIGGSILQQDELLEGFVSDVQTLVKAGVSIAIVHGGGPAIDLKLAAINKIPNKVQGLRVTDAETLAIVLEELSAINDIIVKKLSVPGMAAVGFKPQMNPLFSAEKLMVQGADGSSIDIGFVGEVVNTNLAKLMACFHQGAVPVVAPLGSDLQGVIYNINADHAALAIASAFNASSLISITDVPGLLANPEDSSSLIKHLTLAEAEAMLTSSAVSGGMVPKLKSCIKSIKSGVKKVQIIDGHSKHGLLTAITEPLQIGSTISLE